MLQIMIVGRIIDHFHCIYKKDMGGLQPFRTKETVITVLEIFNQGRLKKKYFNLEMFNGDTLSEKFLLQKFERCAWSFLINVLHYRG